MKKLELKNPSTLVTANTLNETQRKSIGAGKYAGPRVRDVNEAMPITFRTSKLDHMTIPVMASVRPGADDHLSVRAIGVPC